MPEDTNVYQAKVESELCEGCGGPLLAKIDSNGNPILRRDGGREIVGRVDAKCSHCNAPATVDARNVLPKEARSSQRRIPTSARCNECASEIDAITDEDGELQYLGKGDFVLGRCSKDGCTGFTQDIWVSIDQLKPKEA